MHNLLKLILEKVEYDNYLRLIEEGKDPIELLHYKFKNVPSEIIDDVIAIDPTKKKSYSQWLLSKWNDEKKTIINNLDNGRIEKLFNHYKNNNDIQIKDCPSVKDGLESFVPEEDTVLTKSNKPTTLLQNRGWKEEVPSSLANDFDIVFNEDDWIIAVPHTYEASCKLGENMNWCTAGGRSSYEDGRGYYNRYLRDYGGEYYVNFNMSKGESRLGKNYPFTRYQFHFESHQFMDKEDDPVELSEIGIPESAMEFYEKEGYDSDNFQDMETRIMNYEEDRYGSYYGLNDDLYLNIAYDEDLEYHEVTDDTDFYIFGNDDDRDPISYVELPNPFVNEDIVLLNNESLCIIKRKYGKDDNSVLVVINSGVGGYGSRWQAYSFEKYIILPNNIGVFGVNDDDRFMFATDNGEETFGKTKAQNCQQIFINQQCTEFDKQNYERIFFEAVYDGYHGLFAIDLNGHASNEFEMIVKKDTPKNGQYFVINENGLIDGELRPYRAFDDSYYEENGENLNYSLEDKLPNGDYLVSIDNYNEYGSVRQKYNIIKRGTNQPLLQNWFDRYNGYTEHLFSVKYSDKVAFFRNDNGQQVGRFYNRISAIDKENEILIGYIGKIFEPSSEADIIDGKNGIVSATFKDVISKTPYNNKIIILDKDGENSRIYDYMEGKFYFSELNSFKRINEHQYPSLFACSINNSQEMALFDLQTCTIVARNIMNVKKLERYNDMFLKITKLDGKVNAFDNNQKTEMFSNDVDDIVGLNEYVNIIIYVENGKYYPLNYKLNQVMINPNGIGVPTYINDNGMIYCQGNNYNIYFKPSNNGTEYTLYKWQNKSSYGDLGVSIDPNNAPQEVSQMANLIFNNQTNQVTENFKHLFKRINEASKLRYNERFN